MCVCVCSKTCPVVIFLSKPIMIHFARLPLGHSPTPPLFFSSLSPFPKICILVKYESDISYVISLNSIEYQHDQYLSMELELIQHLISFRSKYFCDNVIKIATFIKSKLQNSCSILSNILFLSWDLKIS